MIDIREVIAILFFMTVCVSPLIAIALGIAFFK